MVLLEFLDDAYPSHSPRLLPSDPVDRAVARIWIDHFSKKCLLAVQRLTQLQEKEQQDNNREALYKAQKELAEQVKGPYFFGEQFSIVDVVVAPWVERDWVITEKRGYDRGAAGEAWVNYARVLSERPSVRRTNSVSAEHCQNSHQLNESK